MAKFQYLSVSVLLCFFISAKSSDAFSSTAVSFSMKKRNVVVTKQFNRVRFPIEQYPMFALSGGRVSASTNADDPANTPPYKLSTPQLVYVFLTSIFVTCLLVADIVGVKLFEIQLPFPILGHKTIEHTCGVLIFPITFVLGDTINEYYGPKATKTTVYIGLYMSILVFGIVNIAQALPFLNKPFNVSPEAFNAVFGSAKLMYVASVLAYLAGQLMDIWLFGVIKRLTGGKYLWLRATGSTVLSQIFDSFVVSYVAFGFGKRITGQIPASLLEIWNIAVTGYGMKFVMSGLITPLLYLIRNVLHNKFGLRPLPVDNDDDK